MSDIQPYEFNRILMARASISCAKNILLLAGQETLLSLYSIGPYEANAATFISQHESLVKDVLLQNKTFTKLPRQIGVFKGRSMDATDRYLTYATMLYFVTKDIECLATLKENHEHTSCLTFASVCCELAHLCILSHLGICKSASLSELDALDTVLTSWAENMSQRISSNNRLIKESRNKIVNQNRDRSETNVSRQFLSVKLTELEVIDNLLSV